MLFNTLLTIHPNRQRGIFGVFSRLEEPEVRVDLVCLVLDAQVGERSGWKVNIAREAPNTFCSLAEFRLEIE